MRKTCPRVAGLAFALYLEARLHTHGLFCSNGRTPSSSSLPHLASSFFRPFEISPQVLVEQEERPLPPFSARPAELVYEPSRRNTTIPSIFFSDRPPVFHDVGQNCMDFTRCFVITVPGTRLFSQRTTDGIGQAQAVPRPAFAKARDPCNKNIASHNVLKEVPQFRCRRP